MMKRGRSKERLSSNRKVTPPSPTYMNNDQFASYLANLRDNRVNRPGGARPLPPSSKPHRDSTERLATGRSSFGSTSVLSEASNNHQRVQSEIGTIKPRGSRPSFAPSMASRYSTMTSTTGRDYYQNHPAVTPLKPGEVVPSATYMERGQRWMEKEEAVSLREAMDAMDAMDIQKDEKKQGKEKTQDGEQDEDESRLYNAALDEAAELVWQHQHGVQPPEPGAPYRYKPHLRKNSYGHARAASAGRYGSDIGATGLARDSIRSFSGSSSSSDMMSEVGSPRESMDQQRTYSMGSTKSASKPAPKPASKSYGAIGGAPRSSSGSRRLSSLKRNISGEVEKPFSGDQIWEEPETASPERTQTKTQLPWATKPLGPRAKGVPNRVSFAPDAASDSATPPPAATSTPTPQAPTPTPSPAPTTTAPAKPLSRFEIHKNPPSQSRNPAYTTNNKSDSPRNSTDVPTKNGMEVRGDDIRLATSMRLKDRSAKLPTPSAVSDSPGRPIVSFDKNWKPQEDEATDPKPEEPRNRVPFGVGKEQQSRQQTPLPPVPTIAVTPDIQVAPPSRPNTTTPAIPSIQVDIADNNRPNVPVIAVSSDDKPTIPTIVLPGDDFDSNNNSNGNNAPSIPTIVTPDDSRKPPTRPLPDPKSARSNAQNRRSHWSPAPGQGVTGNRATALCHECGFPIEGRFVALAGVSQRFHPQCFRCYACGTALEALEISPEPDNFRAERLDRIHRRAAGEVLEEEPGKTMAEDGDSRLRFYCHLDWHELYAPRCKHCKTPILGEHVVALGAHWHYGHFFCAECGDPFERGATHIEKDGYAWCVGCQTRRTERRAPKCRGCRQAVVGQYVRALGGEWHDACFRCSGCAGGFDDGQIFPMKDRGEDVVLCTRCRAAELKM